MPQSTSAVDTLDTPRPLPRHSLMLVGIVAALLAASVGFLVLMGEKPLSAVPTTHAAHALGAALLTGLGAFIMYLLARTAGRPAYVLLGSAFSYMAVCSAASALTSPDALTDGPPLLGGPQGWLILQTSWRFVVLPAVGVSAWMFFRGQRQPRRRFRHLISLSLLAVGVLSAVTIAVVAANPDWLPQLTTAGGRDTAIGRTLHLLQIGIAVAAFALSALALQARTIINLWLAACALVLLVSTALQASVLDGMTAAADYTIGGYTAQVAVLTCGYLLLFGLIWAVGRVGNTNARAAAIDAVTLSLSRSGLRWRLTEDLRRAELEGDTVGVLWVNLNDFSSLNEALSPEVGDLVLGAVAERLLAAIGDGGVLARPGGDEFVVVLYSADTTTSSAFAEALLEELSSAPVVVDDHPLQLTASAGVACYPIHAQGVTEILGCARLAYKAAHRAGPGMARQFSSGLLAEARERNRMRQGLNRAVRDESFDLDYQPIVDPITGELRGAEALLRWVRDGQRVPAGQFIDFAERSGLIAEMGRFGVNALAAAMPRLQSVFKDPFFVTLNMSPTELRDPATAELLLCGELADYADAVVVEITESAQLAIGSTSEKAVRALRGCGYRIAIDDFGKGYSNLVQLTHLHAEFLKLDRTLIVEGSGGIARSCELVTGVAGVVASLDSTLIAEGVETERQRSFVEEIGAPLAQGYLWSTPVQLDVLCGFNEKWLGGCRGPDHLAGDAHLAERESS